MPTKTVTTAASCKHCGGTVMIRITSIFIDDNKARSSSGGVSSSMCSKCNKTSMYTYSIDNEGQLQRLN
jgi:RecJ-like exonuclease